MYIPHLYPNGYSAVLNTLLYKRLNIQPNSVRIQDGITLRKMEHIHL